MFFKRTLSITPMQFSSKRRKRKLSKTAISSSKLNLFKNSSNAAYTEKQVGCLTDQQDLSPDFDDHPDSFFKSTRSIVIMAQFFGVLMVHGIIGKNFTSIYFKYKSWKIIYIILLMIGTFFILCCSFVENLRLGFTFDRSTALIFFSMGIVTTTTFLRIANHWHIVCREFALVEKRFQSYGYPSRVGLKLKCVTFLFLVGAFVENMMSYMLSIQVSSSPGKLSEWPNMSPAQRFFRHHFNQIFTIFEFAYWKAILIFYINVVTTFWWNFNDLFLTLMSLSIIFKIRQFNKEMFQNIGKIKSSDFWNKAREDYNSLSLLTKKIDKIIGKLMLMSLGTNLYFVCTQLFKSLKNPDRGAFDGVLAIYFNWSFGFLLFRTMSVGLSAANVHDASKEIKTVLYSIPKQGYTEEAERLLIQVDTDEILLTGWGFFSVTKKFLLSIAGTIMTYEIFLVQLIP